MKKMILFIGVLFFFTSCNEKYRKINKDDVVVSSKLSDSINAEPKTQTELREELLSNGYQIFDVIDEKTKDTVIMQQYFIAFLKSGPTKMENEEEAQRLQREHLSHLKKMYDLGYADISGPFSDVGAIQSMSIYSVPTLKMADSLANTDPLVKDGHLVVEMHSWWAPKGYSLR